MRVLVWLIVLFLAACAVVTVNTGAGKSEAPAAIHIGLEPKVDVEKDTK